MRALLNLALPVIVWIGLALIMPLMVSVWLKIALPILQKTVPVLMPQQLNVAISVIIATPLAHQALLLLIPALSALIMNADNLVKDVLPLVLRAA